MRNETYDSRFHFSTSRIIVTLNADIRSRRLGVFGFDFISLFPLSGLAAEYRDTEGRRDNTMPPGEYFLSQQVSTQQFWKLFVSQGEKVLAENQFSLNRNKFIQRQLSSGHFLDKTITIGSSILETLLLVTCFKYYSLFPFG